jgi:gamma-butyrobetaine dioxygenase
VEAGLTGPDLELAVSGQVLRFPAVWLRDNCPCPECVAPGTTQKLKDMTDLPNGVAVTLTEHAADSVTLTFAPDQHRATFSRSWLAAQAPGRTGDGDGRTEDDKQLWLPADLAPETGRFPRVSWPRYLDRAAERIRALEAVRCLGFVLLRDVPAAPGTVLEVAASFGFVRETNYGRLFDVRVEAAPGNLAFTSRAIRPHTDNPYRDPVPTVQLLHCLRAAGEGGDTGLVDGFAAAGALRAADPESFGTLTGTPAPFG